MIRTVIIDDENHAITNICTMLQKFEDVKIEYTATNPEDAIAYLVKNDADLVFLDIKMPGQTGFDVLDSLNNLGANSFKVVFLTAYDEFAIKAIKYTAFDYLLKPVDKQELQETINRVIAEKNTHKPYGYSQLLDLLKTEAKLKINTPNGYEFINTNDIAYAESTGNYTNLVLTNNTSRTVSKTLKEIETELEQFSFVRVHRKNLINKKHLAEYDRRNGKCILLCNTNTFEVEVSSRMSKNLL